MKTKNLKLHVTYGEPMKHLHVYVKIAENGKIIRRYTIPPFVVHAIPDYGHGYASRELLRSNLDAGQITIPYTERAVIDLQSFFLRLALTISAFAYCSFINV